MLKITQPRRNGVELVKLSQSVLLLKQNGTASEIFNVQPHRVAGGAANASQILILTDDGTLFCRERQTSTRPGLALPPVPAATSSSTEANSATAASQGIKRKREGRSGADDIAEAENKTENPNVQFLPVSNVMRRSRHLMTQAEVVAKHETDGKLSAHLLAVAEDIFIVSRFESSRQASRLNFSCLAFPVVHRPACTSNRERKLLLNALLQSSCAGAASI